MSSSRVLLAEDHLLVREVIVQILAAEHEVAGCVERGDLVLAEAKRLRPDVLLLDVSLPGASGLSILPVLRSALPDAAIIMLTTHVEPVYESQALERGADGYVLKGRARTELLPAIRSALARRRGTEATLDESR